MHAWKRSLPIDNIANVVEDVVAEKWPELARSPIRGLWFTGSSIWRLLYPPSATMGSLGCSTRGEVGQGDHERDHDMFVLDEETAWRVVIRMGWTRFPACPTHAKKDPIIAKTISEYNVPKVRDGKEGTAYGDGVSYATDRGVVDLWISTTTSAIEEIRAYPEESHDHCRAAFSFSDGLIVLPNQLSRRIKSERHPFDPT